MDLLTTPKKTNPKGLFLVYCLAEGGGLPQEGGGMSVRFCRELARKENRARIPLGATAPILGKVFFWFFVFRFRLVLSDAMFSLQILVYSPNSVKKKILVYSRDSSKKIFVYSPNFTDKNWVNQAKFLILHCKSNYCGIALLTTNFL